MSDYSWVPVFTSIADWIADYQDRQPELVEILRAIGVDKGLEDELEDGSKVPLTEIDPFTFFATFMKYGVDKRRDLFEALLKRVGLNIPAPRDFDGVPSAQPLKVWLFPYAKSRTPEMVPSLWELFFQARADKIDGDLFDEILKIPHTGFAKLTECLFYIEPTRYFPVDAQTSPWLAKQGFEKFSPSWANYSKLLDWLATNAKDAHYVISHVAWMENQGRDFNAESALVYLDERYPGTRSGTIHLSAFKTDTNRELAFDQGKNPGRKRKINVFVDARPPEDNFQQVEEYLPSDGRNHHLKSHAPSLAIGKQAYAVEVVSQEMLDALCDWYENSPDSVSQVKEEPEALVTQYPLNQILYGPPGTGKTFATTELAVQIADPQWYAASLKQYEGPRLQQELKRRYDELVADQRVLFTTFHQSFSYEDFIEGIRARTNDESKQIEYYIEDGVFKRIALAASRATSADQLTGLSAEPKIWKISIGEKHEVDLRNIYLTRGEARIGWNDTGDLDIAYDSRKAEQQAYWDKLSDQTKNTITYFQNDIRRGDVLLCLKDQNTVQAVGIVTGDYYFDASEDGYAHARKVNWILRDINFNILSLNSNRVLVQKAVYPLERMTWNDIVLELKHQGIPLPAGLTEQPHPQASPNYVLIIDEINRGNISRIFGELITLLEPSKRKGAHDERSATLPCSKDEFSVPANLYVVGTMNTADKSLAQLDLALRRRFSFVEMLPKPSSLRGVQVFGVDLEHMLSRINQRIEALLDHEHMIGHSYFMLLLELKEEAERQQQIASIFKDKLLPLLQEYFFDDHQRIGWVLNDPVKEERHRFVLTGKALNPNLSNLSDLFPQEIAEQLFDRRYRVNAKAFACAEAYQGIVA